MSNRAASQKPSLDVSSLYGVKGKVCVVTGGATGIGKMFAAAYVQNGAKVYIASRKIQPLQAAADELNSWGPGKAIAIQADVSSKAGCKALCDEIRKHESKIHILVNNSGVSWGASLNDFPEKEGWDNLFSLNVKSLFYMTVGLLDLLEKDSTNTEPARVINISSVAGIVPIAENPLSAPGQGTWSYAASKSAASHLSRSLAASLAGRSITVNAVAPGVFPSRMTAFGLSKHEDKLVATQPTGRVGDAQDMGGLALFLASRGAAHITGAVIPIDGGASLGAKL
ncbi:hypothetical protein PROFUN_01298 [Planoprotostelium fungivorum]|uniref:Uncharacterized protein n=1 Tax=Planoprotostelium fungivorum TaxID=1890364 RepID=A0A2P6NZN3_9EUKA|nr:hypothetical protein PROFUN_01298 [Planoprotostelium fungivorum]